MKMCEKCDGTGSIALGSVFFDQGEQPTETKVCDECNGTGMIPETFFVEVVFKSKSTGRTYWMPVFVNAENFEGAKKVVKVTLVGLSKDFQLLNYSSPILERDFSRPIIQSKFDSHKKQKLNILTATVWKLVDVQPDLELSFDDNIKYVVEHLPLEPRTIAHSIECHRFPVRLLREGEHNLNFSEFLVIDVLAE